MHYLLDTVTLVRHFTDRGKIGNKAREIIEQKSNHFYISIISLKEILYLSEKKLINVSLDETLRITESSSLYSIVNLTPEILKVAETTIFDELHDRLILSTAKWLQIPIISSDKMLADVKGVEVIWN